MAIVTTLHGSFPQDQVVYFGVRNRPGVQIAKLVYNSVAAFRAIPLYWSRIAEAWSEMGPDRCQVVLEPMLGGHYLMLTGALGARP